jgi:UDP-2,4-diacetamido-2,4,6-trideoxy-beta-L-altropyranose hydrolase
MNVVFRVDASLQIGSGHVMRCLSLAHGLAARGAHCIFLTRMHPGNLCDTIQRQGYPVHDLAAEGPECQAEGERGVATEGLSHASWLGCTWQTDAHQTALFLQSRQVDLLVVDHYALDYRWEGAIRPGCGRVMAIDDLADRRHNCDFLLDQNLGRGEADYASLLGDGAKLLVGPSFALLRQEFAVRRPASLRRRRSRGRALSRILISMGGVDQANATGHVLAALRQCRLPSGSNIGVIMGSQAPWLAQVRESAMKMPWPTEVFLDVGDMARRMAASDLAIGAAGSTAWERCCMGLPSMIVVLAENQWPGASALSAAGAASLIGEVADIERKLPLALTQLQRDSCLEQMSNAASAVTDGHGVTRVLQALGVPCD